MVLPIRHSHRASPDRSIQLAEDLNAADSLFDGNVDIVVVGRSVPAALADAASRRCAFGPVFNHVFHADRGVLNESELVVIRPELGDAAAEHVISDLRIFMGRWSMLTGRRHARATLSLVDIDKCRKLHVDHLDLRILCTYEGPGTWVAPEASLDRSAIGVPGEGAVINKRICRDNSLLHQANAGDVVFLKGRTWQNGARGAVHRSPLLERTRKRRLLLTIDGMGCGC